MNGSLIFPELRGIHSPDLEPPNLPADPYECSVAFEVAIGPKGEQGSEFFTFEVVTPAFLARTPGGRWGRGKLIIPAFEWRGVIEQVARLLADAGRPTWNEVVAEIDKTLVWAFDRADDVDA